MLVLLPIVGLLGCIEEIAIDTSLRADIDIEEVLVVEATLTDELKQHEILLSRGSSFANDSIQPVIQNATVLVLTDNGSSYTFSEVVPGRYLSDEAFQALPNVAYQLSVSTASGGEYLSDLVELPQAADIVGVYAERITNTVGVEGMAIYVDAELSANQAPQLRYQYEETFKVIAPLWSPLDVVVVNPNPPFAFELVRREQEERTCYRTQRSNTILQPASLNVTGNTIERILIRFIPRDDYILSHRYSILVKQYAQSPDAHNFYRTLKEQSSNDNVFSGIQPGFIEGNIRSSTNANEKVIGFFEVASTNEKRLFFNYQDFFPNEDLPPYPFSCRSFSAPSTITIGGSSSPLKDAIESGNFVYVDGNFGQVPEAGPYLMTRRPCGDCTTLGSNIVPEFWTE